MRKVLVILFMFVVCFVAGFIYGQKADFNLFTKGDNTYKIGTIEKQVKEISELATLEYRYTNTDVFEGDSLKLFGKNVPFTSKSMTVQYDGIVKLGPDMSKATADLKKTKLTITIPESKVLSHEIDEDSWKILDKNNGIFNPVTPEDNQDFRKECKKTMEKTLDEKGLIKKANTNAKKQIQSFFQAAYPDLEVVVLLEGETDTTTTKTKTTSTDTDKDTEEAA